MTEEFAANRTPGSPPTGVRGQMKRRRAREYLGSRSHETALEALHGALRDEAELIVLIGEGGAGKSTVLRKLAQELSGIARPVYCPAKGLDFSQILGVVCADLQLTFKAPARRFELEALTEAITNSTAGAVALLVDDADRLHGDALDHLLRLSRAIVRQRRKFHLVLSGQRALQQRLRRARSSHPAAARAVFAHLTRLGRGEVATLLGQLAATRLAAGKLQSHPAALGRIADASRGLPGRTVALFNAAVNAAERAGHTTLSPALVEHTVAQFRAGSAPVDSPPPAARPETPASPGRQESPQDWEDADRPVSSVAPWHLPAAWRIPVAAGVAAAAVAIAFGVGAYLLDGTENGVTGRAPLAAAPTVAGNGASPAAFARPPAARASKRETVGADREAQGTAVTAQPTAPSPTESMPTPAAPVRVESPVSSARPGEDMAARLRRAWAAFDRNALTTPQRDNAVRWAESVLSASPGEASAFEVLQAVVDRYLEWSNSNLRARDVKDAARYLDRARALARYASPEQVSAIEVLDGEIAVLERQMARAGAKRERQYRRQLERERRRNAPPTDGPKWIRDIDTWLRTLPLPRDG